MPGKDVFASYIPLFILGLLGIVVAFGGHLLARFFRPHNPTPLKETPYECGELPVGVAWSAFNVRFYVVGLVFIIFDVESSLMFPVAAVVKKLNDVGMGLLVFWEIVLFVLILFSGLAYCWRQGDLDWVKSYRSE